MKEANEMALSEEKSRWGGNPPLTIAVSMKPRQMRCTQCAVGINHGLQMKSRSHVLGRSDLATALVPSFGSGRFGATNELHAGLCSAYYRLVGCVSYSIRQE